MRRRLSVVSGLLASVMLFSSLFAGVRAEIATEGLGNFVRKNTFFDGIFSDVRTDDWFYGNVKTAYEKGLMVGNSETTFNPTGNVKISETITIAARLHSIYTSGSDEFEASEPWYRTYVDYAKENGIITKDYPDYNRAATRAEFAEILSASLPDEALDAMNSVADNAIPDVSIEEEYSNSVYRLYRAGILVGSDEVGTFHPESNIKRSEVAAIVSRMADVTLRKFVSLDVIIDNEVINPWLSENGFEIVDDDTFAPEDGTEEEWDISVAGESTVVARLLNNKTDGTYTLSVSGQGNMKKLGQWNKGRFVSEAPWISPEFSCREKITSIKIGANITSVSDGVFFDLVNAVRVDIPAGVTSIGIMSFGGCSALTDIILPIGLTEIGEAAFYGCRSLKSAVIPAGITVINEDTFCGCTSLASIVIPPTVTKIGAGAFCGCESLTSINIPTSVSEIGFNAFGVCSSLREVTVPAEVTSIGDCAFVRCTSLETITVLNKDCEIFDSPDTFPVNATIRGYRDSTAQSYAEMYGLKFVAID